MRRTIHVLIAAALLLSACTAADEPDAATPADEEIIKVVPAEPVTRRMSPRRLPASAPNHMSF